MKWVKVNSVGDSWVEAAIRAIPEAREPDCDSRILLKSKLFWLSDIQMKLDELSQLDCCSGVEATTEQKAMRRRYRKGQDGRSTLFYKSEKLGWLPVLAVEHYPTVCRNVIRNTDESVWLTNLRECHHYQYHPSALSQAQKGRYFGKYMTTKYHLNAGLMEKFYLWIEDHVDQIEEEETQEKLHHIEEQGKDRIEPQFLEDNQDFSNKEPKRRCHHVTPLRIGGSLQSLLDLGSADSSDNEDHGEQGCDGSAEAAGQRLSLLEDQNLVLTNRVSDLEAQNVALETKLRTIMLVLKEAKLL